MMGPRLDKLLYVGVTPSGALSRERTGSNQPAAKPCLTLLSALTWRQRRRPQACG